MTIQLDPAAARRSAGELHAIERELSEVPASGPLGLPGTAAEVDAALDALGRAAALARSVLGATAAGGAAHVDRVVDAAMRADRGSVVPR